MEGFLAQRGYRVAPFTIENFDFMFNTTYLQALSRKDGAAERVRSAYLAFHRRDVEFFEAESRRVLGEEIPQVLLLHANRLNADVMEAMLEAFTARGYRFVTLETALSHPAYAIPDRYTGPKGLSWLHRWTLAKGLPMRDKEEPQPPKMATLLDPEP